MVLQEYGEHQVIGWDTSMQRVRERLTTYVNNDFIHPDPELRYLLHHARPLALAPSLRHMVEHSDVVYFMTPGWASSPVGGVIGEMGAFPDREFILVLGRKTRTGKTRRFFADTRQPWAYNPLDGPPSGLVQALVDPPEIWLGTDHQAAAIAIRGVWTPVVNTRPIIMYTPEAAEIAYTASCQELS
jgi:hypothetical protein